MQIVIDLSDDLYNTIKENKYDVYKGRIYDAIRQGTPLTEHYGDLKDADAIRKYITNELGLGDEENGGEPYYKEGLSDCYEYIKTAPTIIPATKEKSCEDCNNWNEHYGTAECMLCENRKLWTPKQTEKSCGQPRD